MSSSRKVTFQPGIMIFDNDKNKHVSQERKEFVRDQEIFIDQHLTWKHHIDHAVFKISRNIGLLSKLRHHVPTQTLIKHLSASHFTAFNLWHVSLGYGAKLFFSYNSFTYNTVALQCCFQCITILYYMACVCSRYSARSVWLIVTEL